MPETPPQPTSILAFSEWDLDILLASLDCYPMKTTEGVKQLMIKLRTARSALVLTGGDKCVMQSWTFSIPMMQQTVLLTAIRGPDGLPKYSTPKMLLRWLRRCVLLSAIDGCALTNPCASNGGSFTGPSVNGNYFDWESRMNEHVDEYLKNVDTMPLHFHHHLLHAVEILGYKHPIQRIREWWYQVYIRLVNDTHMHPETENELDRRLGDTREGWLERADPATAN